MSLLRKIMTSRILYDLNALQNLVNSLPNAIFIKDATSKFIFMNEACEAQLGMRFSEIAGTDASHIFSPDQMELFFAKDREVFEGGCQIYFEEIFWNASLKQNRFGQTFKTPIYDDFGKPLYLICTTIDITERKQAETEEIRVRNQLEATINAIPDLLFELGLDGTYYYIHALRPEFLPALPAELSGKKVFDVLPPEAAKVVMSALYEAFEQGHSTGKQFVLSLLQGDLWFELSVSRKPAIDEDQPRFIVLSREITWRKKLEQGLRNNQDRLNEAERLGHLGCWELNLVSDELIWSDEIYRIFELDPVFFTPSYENFLNLIHPEDRRLVNHAYTQSLKDRQPYDVRHRLLFADGRIKWVREHCISYFDKSGKPYRSVGAVQDITEQKIIEDRFRVEAVTFETHEAIMITNSNGNIIRVNQAFQLMTGYSAEEVMGKNPRILSSERHNKAFYDGMWRQLKSKGTWSGEIWDKRKGGQIYPKWQTITSVRNDKNEITEYVAIFSDITSRKQAEDEIRNLAFYDSLTGLPNRRLLMDRLHLALTVSARSRSYGGVLFLDMDKFKTLNDTLGHDYGDLMLMEVAERIESCVREVDTVARLGGDEFVVLLEEVDEHVENASQKIAQIAEKIRASLAEPYQLKDQVYHSSPSIGVTLYCGHSETVDALLKHADMAMYQAKDSGRNAVCFFDPVMQLAVETRASLEADLRRAVPEGQLQLHYQIQVDNDHRPIGAEALVRWCHPQRGMVFPAQFITIAEDSSLILDIGYWVLEAACRQLGVWAKSVQTRDLTLAVNVSAKQFRQDNFVEQVAQVLRAHGVAASRLKLELTESVVFSDVTVTVAKMHVLKALGVKLSMDDFGTGYSSLSCLKLFPLDQIKIDQSFVHDVAIDPSDAVMVKTIIDMAKNFGLNVIAEGVETQEQLDFIKQNGCMEYQGYLFSKPVPIEQFEALLKQG